MARHRSRQSFGLPSGTSGGAARLTPRQVTVGAMVVVIVLGTLVYFAAAGKPSQAVLTAPFGGSLVLNDQQGPVVLDLASGTASIQLANVDKAVTAPGPANVDAVPVTDGSLLLNSETGTFNFLGQNNVLVAPTGGGVALSGSGGVKSAAGFAAGPDAYVVGNSPSGATVSLVNEEVVSLAAKRTTTTTAGGSTTVQPLGSATTTSPLSATSAGSVTANGDLWTLEDAPSAHRVIRYGPARQPAEPLVKIDRGTAPAIATLGASAGASGTQSVALATPTLIRVFGPGSRASATSVPVNGLGAATHIVAVSGVSGGVLFAYQLPSGWRLVGVDAATHKVTGPVDISGVPAADSLLSPAYNNGSIYTLGYRYLSSQPALLRIDPQSGAATPLSGFAQYPLVKSTEVPTFGAGTQVISIGPRVIFNNPTSVLGVVVFTDGSSPPKVFDKGTLATVDPAAPGGVASPRTNPTKAKPKNQTPVQAAVDPQSLCENTQQKPHRPVITTPLVPSTHTVTLSWSYQLLSNQDCEPTSYLVSASTVGGGQNPSQAQYEVQGQLSFIYPGLHPNTTYQFTVTALIGQQQTSSLPEEATTTPQGPDKPTSVSVTDTDGTGWTVSWTSCSGAACDANEPATQWTVTGQTCSGDTFIGTPPTTTVDGSVSTTTFKFADNADLIGQALNFEVQGTDVLGHVGDPATANACVTGWALPSASSITFSASNAQAADFTDTATLSVAPAAGVSAAQAFGSLNTEFTYGLANITNPAQRPVQVGNSGGGPTGSPTATFTGVIPGDSYSATVIVTPVGHPSAATTLPAQSISGVSSAWPAISLASAAPVLDPSADTGALNVTLGGAFANVPSGQAIVLSASGSISCAGTLMPAFNGLAVTPVAGESGVITGIPLALVNDGGPGCALNLVLTEAGTNVHGGPYSNAYALPPLGTQYPTPSIAADVTATPTCAYCVDVSATTVLEAGTTSVGGLWDATVTSTDGISTLPCSVSAQLAPSGGASVATSIDMSGCVANFVNADSSVGSPVTVTFAVTVSWTYLGLLSGPVSYGGAALETGPLDPTTLNSALRLVGPTRAGARA